MLSNKLTFSLASLVVLIAFGLVFAPMSAIGHDGNAAHDALEIAHRVVKITIADADKYANADTRAIKVTAVITSTADTVADRADLDVKHDTLGAPDVGSELAASAFGVTPATGAWEFGTAARDFVVSDDRATYTFYLEPPGTLADDEFTVAMATGDTATVIDATSKNTFTVDTMLPTVGEIEYYPVSGDFEAGEEGDEITKPFVVEVTVNDDDDGTGIDADTVKIKVEGGTAGDRSRARSDTFKWTVTPDLSMDEATVTVTASDMAGNDGMTSKGFTLKKAPTPETALEGVINIPAVTIPANGFLVLAYSSTDAGIEMDTRTGTAKTYEVKDAASGEWINLDTFFLNGGTIGVIGPSAIKAERLVISEIMWGTDSYLADKGADTDTTPDYASQWIELYNTGGELKIAASAWELELVRGTTLAGANVVDSVGNLNGPAFWEAKGNGGRSTRFRNEEGRVDPIVPLVSMYRKIDYDKVEKGDHDSDTDKNRVTQLEGVPDGPTVPGDWEVSARPSAHLASGRIGTPGAPTSKRISAADKTAYSQDVLINEVGNGTGDANDWVELLNTTSSEINLKNWQLSIVTEDADGVASETSLLIFPDNDNTKLPANRTLLIANTDPRASNNDLAAGIKIDTKVDDQAKRGAKSLYYIASSVKIPDTGKSLLVLRNAKDKAKKPEKIIDVGGTLFHAVDGELNDVNYSTGVWPLQATAKGHGDVVKDDPPEDFRAPLVYKRAGKNTGIGEHHWEKVGFTGIGYDRTASKSDENGGTPGYPNDALKEKVADLSGIAEVSISEIMVDAGTGARSLPQWIELYNSSLTQGVNLNEWTLEIQNASSDDVEARLNSIITLKGMTIPPNQTVLIVSTSGLNSGTDHFPATRIINLWTDPDHRDDLQMTSRGDQVLSATGFYIKLSDKDEMVVDEVGNLDGDRRTRDEPAWAFPMSSEEGRRSSMIRKYDEGTVRIGTSADAWVAATDTSLAYAISHTYYGTADDLGTPNFRGGGPLPVSLSSFRPARDTATGAVVIRWATESELDNAGFNILRSETKTGEFKVVNLKGIIPGHGTTSEKHVYEWKDTSAKPNVVYYYQIEDVSLDGKRTTLRTTHLRGNVNAAGKLTTTWSQLKDSIY